MLYARRREFETKKNTENIIQEIIYNITGLPE